MSLFIRSLLSLILVRTLLNNSFLFSFIQLTEILFCLIFVFVQLKNSCSRSRKTNGNNFRFQFSFSYENSSTDRLGLRTVSFKQFDREGWERARGSTVTPYRNPDYDKDMKARYSYVVRYCHCNLQYRHHCHHLGSGYNI